LQTNLNHIMSYEFILVEPAYQPYVALVRLNRPKELNALNLQLMLELKAALQILDADPEVRVIVITGNERAFAAGADIKQMSGKNAIDMLQIDQFSTWDQIRKTKKPIIAAVSGFALGGGCEQNRRDARRRRNAKIAACRRQSESHGNGADRKFYICRRSPEKRSHQQSSTR
jgi:1,4-dihydroxy-2-naphthoyl-CoA synthase